MEHILRKNKKNWFEFQLETQDVQAWYDLFSNKQDPKKIKGYSDEMINVNMIEAQRMIQEVVKTRFESLYNCYEDDGSGGNGAYNPSIKNKVIPQWFKTDVAETT